MSSCLKKHVHHVFMSKKKHVHHVFMSKKNMYIMSSCLNTIFAFLTLNTPRSAHNKIFGSKFLSFEQLVLTSSQPTHYTVNKQNTPRIAQQNQPVHVAKKPLLHCHRATAIMQNSLSCLPIVEVLECKRGCFVV